MKDLITVVIPVYNVEKYLDRCVNSIVNQTYTNLEIILVDDGSPDNCPKMCDDWRKKDKRIKVIHKKNGGLSDARNFGIDKAKGKYITFVDSDDWLSLNAIEDLYVTIIKNKADISEGLITTVYHDNSPTMDENKYETNNYNCHDALEELMYLHFFSNSAPSKLYRLDLFKNIRYPVGKQYEDLATTYKLFSKSKNTVLIKKTIYYYYQNHDSIMHKQYSSKRLEGLNFALEELDYISENYSDITLAAIYRLFFECLSIINDMPYKCNDKKNVMKYIKEYRSIVTHDKNLWLKQKMLCFASYFGQFGIKLSFYLKKKRH